MKKKTLVKIALGVLSVVGVLAITLVVHIYIVTRKPATVKNDMRVRQLSRIDFKQDITQPEADKIRGFVGGLEGVESTHFNVEDDVLVYTYAVGSQNSDDVYKKVVALGNYKADKYVVSAEAANTGCPIGADKKSPTGKFTAFVTNLFN